MTFNTVRNHKPGVTALQSLDVFVDISLLVFTFEVGVTPPSPRGGIKCALPVGLLGAADWIPGTSEGKADWMTDVVVLPAPRHDIAGTPVDFDT